MVSRKEYHKNYHESRKDDPEYKRLRLVNKRKKYNLTPEEYEAKYAAQNRTCALCGKRFVGGLGSKNKFAPVLDHNHKTGKNRDFIHRACNFGIGSFYDDPSVCRKAAEYLEKHKETQ